MTVLDQPRAIPPPREVAHTFRVIKREDSDTAADDYLRLAVFALQNAGADDTAHCLVVDLRVPTVYLAGVLAMVGRRWPDVHSYLVEWYNKRGRVLLWYVPAMTETEEVAR